MKRFSKTFLPPVALLFVCLIAYLPLSSFRFTLKNDAFIYNFPNKFFFSEALHAGIIPLWNPYLNYGFPLYADPGFAWWQPITWIFGFIGYTPYTFTIEVLLYIFIAGLGMYWLGTVLNVRRATAFAIGCMFMCSGFFIGNLQHINFLTCAAFLPWLTGAWLKYQKCASISNLIWCSTAIYLLCTGGHPAIPIAAAYFFFVLTILYYGFHKKTISLKIYIPRQLKLLGCSALFLFPLLLSYWQIWPYYSRSTAVVQSQTLDVGFTLPAYISFFSPFGTIKNNVWFHTDVSMRNAYFSLAGILLFVQMLISRKKNTLQQIFLFSGVFMLLLAAGGIVKNILYSILPGLNFIRTNGEFRVFAIFIFIVCGALPLDDVLKHKESLANTVKSRFKTIICLMSAVCIVLLIFVKWNIPFSNTNATLPSRIKFILDHLTFPQTLLIALTVACLLSALYFFSLKKAPRFFLWILVVDLIVNSWLLLPITGVSQHSVAEMQAIIDKSPKGFPIPFLYSNNTIKPIIPEQEILIGNWNWYSKQVVYRNSIDYPSMLQSTATFSRSGDTNVVKNKPFIFLENGNGIVNATRFTPNRIDLNTAVQNQDTLVLLQNWYPGWDVWVNEKKVPPQLYQNTFMQVPVDRTTKYISFRFSLF